MERLLFKHALSKIDPYTLTFNALKKENNKISVGLNTYNLDKNVYVIGFGKAVFGMALAVEKVLGEHIMKGILSIPHDKTYKKPNSKKLNIIEAFQGAENNLPDQYSVTTTQKIIHLCKSLPNQSNILLVLISGGGSALLCAPRPPLSLDMQLKIIKNLNSRGAKIQELNTIRSCLSIIKGGKLPNLTANTTQIISLIISDIVGDPLQYIASGPTVAPLYNNAQALEIIRKYELNNLIPKEILTNLVLDNNQDNESLSKTIEERVNNVLIGSNILAVKGIEDEALAKGLYPIVVSSGICGEAELFGKYLARLAIKFLIKCNEIITNDREAKSQNFDFNCLPREETEFVEVSECLLKLLNQRIVDNLSRSCPPLNDRTILLIFGGETTVSLGPECKGVGGRNQEIALSFLNEISRIVIHETEFKSLSFRTNSTSHDPLGESTLLNKIKDITLLSAGTDGQDGPTDATGAIVFPEEESLDYFQNMYEITLPYLESHNSYSFFQNYKEGKFHLKTGLTGTNFMDIQLLTIKFLDDYNVIQ